MIRYLLLSLLITWIYAQTHSPTHTFMDHLQVFVRSRSYYPLIQKAQEVYRENGYYVDPVYIPTNITTKPPCLPSPTTPYYPCYDEYYYPNGYSRGGYDRQGYDQLGFNLAGYNRLGYSRRQARRGEYPPSSYDQNGYFENPVYQNNGYYVIFDGYGNPYSGNAQTGPIRPFDPCYNTNYYDVLVYDNQGYDQYGNNEYGDPQPQIPPPCPPRPTDVYSHIPDEPLVCQSSSEILQPSGKYRFIRKSASAMSANDWQRFRNAWNALNVAGEIGRLVAMHSQSFNQHQSMRFLPWHREFTARLEDALHRYDPCVFLPYWDVVGNPSFPAGIVDVLNPEFPPDVITLDSNNNVIATNDVTVAIGVSGALPNAGLQTSVLAQATFNTFSPAIESFHDAIHVHVGGSLMFITTAPRHPVFYLLHANVDRLWHVWRQTHAGQPTAALVTSSINPLTFGSGDTRTYAQESTINGVQTIRGDGYDYI